MRTTNKSKKSLKPSQVVIYAFLCVLVVIYIFPLLWMVNVSLKTNSEVFKSPFALPDVAQLGNYIFAWTTGKLGIATLNSAIVCGISLVSAWGWDRWRFCNCKDALEIVKAYDVIFSDRYDGAGSLCADPAFYTFL